MWLVKFTPSVVVNKIKFVERVGEPVATGITILVLTPEPATSIASPTRWPGVVVMV